VHFRQHSTSEHYVVFWAGPMAGAALAGLLYRGMGAGSPAAAAKKQQATGAMTSRKPTAAAAGTAETATPVQHAAGGVSAAAEATAPTPLRPGVRRRGGAMAAQASQVALAVAAVTQEKPQHSATPATPATRNRKKVAQSNRENVARKGTADNPAGQHHTPRQLAEDGWTTFTPKRHRYPTRGQQEPVSQPEL
jgi:hypothetical protein